MIRSRLANREFEHSVSLPKQIFYAVERGVGNLAFRRAPPDGPGPRLLNLGCGPLNYQGWVNADDFAFKRWLCESQFRPQWRLDITHRWKCKDSHWDGIFTQHVLEHITYSQATFVLEECFRTLKPGAWLRISVPGIARYVDFYTGREANPFFKRFPFRALAISFFTQMHQHKSAWDGELMTSLLRDIGFESVREVRVGEGTDPRLLRDQEKGQEEKAAESLYVEAKKPA